MSVALTPDVTGPVPINSDDAADHTWVDQLRYALHVTLYRAEQFEHRHAPRVIALMVAVAGTFATLITIGLVA